MNGRLLLCALVLASSGTAYADAGKLKICREPGLTEMLDKKTVPIPSGSSFTNSGPTSDFVVTTTQDITIGPKPGCAIAAAEITENQGRTRVTKKAGRLVPQFSIAGISLQAVVIEDFK